MVGYIRPQGNSLNQLVFVKVNKTYTQQTSILSQTLKTSDGQLTSLIIGGFVRQGATNHPVKSIQFKALHNANISCTISY